MGEISIWDLNHMYDLRRYYDEKMPFELKKGQYKSEFNQLHDEINFKSKAKNYSIIIGIALVAAYLIDDFELNTKDNQDWSFKYSLFHEMKLLMGKDEGGVEGEE